MLSNKLTFSLTLVVMVAVALAFTSVADAQIRNVPVVPVGDDSDALSADDFVIVAKDEASAEAGDATDDGILDADIVQNFLLPDLAHFFNTDVDIFGGTLEVLVLDMIRRVDPDGADESPVNTSDDVKVGPHVNWQDVVATEILWGHDRTPADPADPDQPETPTGGDLAGIAPPGPANSRDPANKQWIELYNDTESALTLSMAVAADATADYDPAGELPATDDVADNDIPDTIAKIVLRFIPDTYPYSGNPDATYYSVNGAATTIAGVVGSPLAALPDYKILGITNVTSPGATAPDRMSHANAFYFYRVVDRVSNVRFARWALPGNGGNTQVNVDFPTTQSLASAYRIAELDSGRNMYKEDADGMTAFKDGTLSSGWSQSIRRRNIRGPYVATPNGPHVYEELAVTGDTKTVVPSDKITINEFRNDPSDANIDWIELYNRSGADINVNDWQISFVTGAYMQTKNASTQAAHYDRTARANDYFDLPDRVIPPDGYLLIVNRQPHDTPLGATGSPLAGAGQDGKGGDGAKHQYHVDAGFNLPNVNHYLIVLRSKKPDFTNGDSEDAYIEDIAGRAWDKDGKQVAAFQDLPTFRFNTDIWPLKGWSKPGDGDLAKYGGVNGFASTGMAWARKDYGKAWFHKDGWEGVGERDGVGYDRNVNLGTSPGTPGYANSSIGLKADIKKGAVTISEIMWDAGPRLDLVQWIELYNSSPSETINLDGWKLEVRNKDDDDIRVSPVDAVIPFKNAPQILPNRTLLIVSAVGPNSVGNDNHVYNLAVENKDDLRLRVRRDVLLSEAGFYLALMDKENNVVDIAGNLSTSRQAPKVLWTLPPGIDDLTEPRRSIRRLYGVPEVDLGKLVWGAAGETEMANSGLLPLASIRKGKVVTIEERDPADNTIILSTMTVDHEEAGWLVSDLQGTTHYGHPNDYGNPGYRRGGPLPVSLSSFRPARDKATGEVVIRWVTESELNNAGFNILRSETKTGEFKVVNFKGIIPGHGTTSEKHVYEWKDTTAKPNVVYYYQIEDVSLDGKRTRLATTHLRGNVNAAGKATTTWGDLKTQQ